MGPHTPSSLLQMLPPSPDCTDKSTADRHFVTWTEQEDEILRQAVATYGTEKWSLIAAQFRNKTGRQCRRRWNTYLSVDFKKGGWSEEEDKMLLEAHRKLGNRWTEIAKLVPGRTDNAVKNRFSALGKKQAKQLESLSGQSKDPPCRRVLEQISNVVHKRSRVEGGQSSPLRKQNQIQQRKPLQAWNVDQNIIARAHPVNSLKHIKSVPSFVSEQSRLQDQREFSHSGGLHSKYSNGINSINLRMFSSSENEPHPMFDKSLSQNGALLDHTVLESYGLKYAVQNSNTWELCSPTSVSQYLPHSNIQDAFINCTPSSRDQVDSPYRSELSTMSSHGALEETFVQCKGTPEMNRKCYVSDGQVATMAQCNSQNGLAISTPNAQHERPLESSSSSDVGSQQADDSVSFHNECFSSVQDNPVIMPEENEEFGVYLYRGDGLETTKYDNIAQSTYGALYFNSLSNIDLTWYSQSVMDEAPSPQFSPSEKQFLLSTFDSSYKQSVPDSCLQECNTGTSPFCSP